MTQSDKILALDIGERRIGVAYSDASTKIASPLTTLEVDGLELERLREILFEYEISHLVVGLPRNQSGEETQQSLLVRDFVDKNLSNLGLQIVFQDESLTSVLAEEHLQKKNKIYPKGTIDMYAAAIILHDYLEDKYGL